MSTKEQLDLKYKAQRIRMLATRAAAVEGSLLLKPATPKLVEQPAEKPAYTQPGRVGTKPITGHFYPQSLERGRRSSRTVMLAIAEMYVQGVSTCDAAKVMAEFGLESLSSTQVSRAAALLDEELAAWRSRPLGEIHYLFLDARYEKLRDGGVVRDAALFSAIGVGADGRLGPSNSFAACQ